MQPLDRITEKLETLHKWHEGHSPLCNCPEHGFVVGHSLAEEEIQKLEKQYGLSLPEEYRVFIKQFGDVSVGPGSYFYRLQDVISENASNPFPLEKPFLGKLSPDFQKIPEEKQWDAIVFLMREWKIIPKDHGIILLSEYSRAIYGVLIINGPNRGNIWLYSGDAPYYGPFGGAEGLHDPSASTEWKSTYTLKDYTFFEWYESWLDGMLKNLTV